MGIIICRTLLCYNNEEDKENTQFDIKIYTEKKINIEKKEIMMNDCFINASLQLLTHEESLIEKIININEFKINSSTPGKGKLIPEFKMLIEKIDNNEEKINPRNIKNIMGLDYEKYETEEQQDSNEFINTLLLEIHDEINQPKK